MVLSLLTVDRELSDLLVEYGTGTKTNAQAASKGLGLREVTRADPLLPLAKGEVLQAGYRFE